MNLASEIISEFTRQMSCIDKRITFVQENVTMVKTAFKEIKGIIVERYGADSEVVEAIIQLEVLINVLKDNVEETYSESHNFLKEKLE